MSDHLPSRIASERCQRARHAEWAETRPALFRSEGFFEDLGTEPAPMLRLRRPPVASQRPLWAGVLASALGLRRA